ncbi:hypothetical protein NMY22_g12777 [Coprinellus aureogranulatus]|nr:hypothetical protein NMY22_g12777 [Coprinellus aureogranulatus]
MASLSDTGLLCRRTANRRCTLTRRRRSRRSGRRCYERRVLLQTESATVRGLRSDLHSTSLLLAVYAPIARAFATATLSVLDFATVDLPSVDSTNVFKTFPANFTFFSPEPATPDASGILHTLAAPPKGTVALLLGQLPQQYLNGAESIIHPSSDTRLPLWVLSFWSKVHLDYASARKKWSDGISWLQDALLEAFQHRVGGVLKSLSRLAWSGELSFEGPLGPITFSKELLTVFLSRSWINDEHVNLLVCWLSEKLAEESALDPSSPTTLLVNTCHFHLIQRVLRTASQIGGIFHVNGNHWVTVLAIPDKGRILYGDPAGQAPDHNIASALIWFWQQHISTAISADIAVYEDMPVPIQNFATDSWNCAVFSFNGLAHHLFPSDVLLLQHTKRAAFGDAARITVFDKLLQEQAAKIEPMAVLVRPLKHRNLDSLIALFEKAQPPAKPKRKSKKKDSITKEAYLAPVFQVPGLPASKGGSLKRKNDEDEDPVSHPAPKPTLVQLQLASFNA